MPTEESLLLARKALAYYDEHLRAALEESHPDHFVAIDPELGEYFTGKSLSEAIQSARAAHPDRVPFTLRVGHKTTVRLGVLCP
jgi:hypothetical protein